MRLAKNVKICLLGMMIVLPVTLLAGCSGDSNTYNTSNTGDSSIYGPKGKVEGVLRDAVTNQPLVGAVIDLGFSRATTNENGQFILENVPAVADALTAGSSLNTFTGSYKATVNLTGTNARLKAYYDTNPTTTTPYYYPDYDYRNINVKFTSKNQPNTSAFQRISSSVVREELTATHDFQIGKLSTTINGVAYYASAVSGKGLQRLPAGSTVKLFTNAVTSNTGAGNTRRLIDTKTTDANGLFTFIKVQSNTAVEFEATTADGKYAGTRTGIATPNTDGGILAIDQIEGTVAANVGVALTAIDTQTPIIIAVTPETGSDINSATAATVVFTFSEAIAASAYADGLTPSTTASLYNDIQVNYNGAKAGNVAHSLAWNSARTQLTVTIPVLGASSKYSVDLTAAIGKLKDSDGNALADPNTLKKIDFTTFGGATAAAPTVTIANSATLDFTSAAVLDWLPTSGAKYYAVYRSLTQNWGTTTNVHPYKLLGTTYNSAYTDTTAADTATADPTNYPATQNKKFVENGAIKLTYNYVVKAINSDNVEGVASAPVLAVDVVGPNLSNNGAFVADIRDGDTAITLYFTEPLNKQAAQTIANYTLTGISPALTITNAVYNGWDDANSRSSVTLTLSAALNPANITRSYISSGADGILSTALVAGDGALLPPNSGGLCISPAGTGDASGAVLSSVAGGDDVVFKPADAPTAMAASIYAGPDGVCNSTVAAGDTIVTASGSKPAANGIGITAATYTNGAINSAANDFTLQTTTLNGIAPATGTADDVIVRAILLTVNPGLTDVAGNTVRLTTTSATTAGNRINSDGTFTLP